MKALVKDQDAPGIWLKDVPMPTCGPNNVLIKVHKTAICGTDMYIYKWGNWGQKKYITLPFIAGHEFVGEIVEVGSEVSMFKPGDRVSGEGHIACMNCRNCRSGRSHICRSNICIGVTRPGAFAEYLSIPATNAYPIPDEIPDNVAAIMDPFGNATHTALSFDMIGEDVLITGAGSIGIMAACIARHVGARHVVVTDVNEYRLKLAEKAGVTLAINPTKTSLSQVMKDLKMHEGFDVGLEMSGSGDALAAMIEHMNHSGKISLLGFVPNGTGIDWGEFILKGLVMKGIYGREMYDTWYKMIAMLQSGLNIEPVITHEFAADDFQEGFDVMASGKSGKVILNWMQ